MGVWADRLSLSGVVWMGGKRGVMMDGFWSGVVVMLVVWQNYCVVVGNGMDS